MRPRASPRAALSLRFSVHWTRAAALGPYMPRTTLPPGMHLRAGRPDIQATLQGVFDSLRDAYSTAKCHRCSSASPSGIVIGSCGPTTLIDDAVRAVNCVSWADWIDMGGVESIEECVEKIFCHPLNNFFESQGIRMVNIFKFPLCHKFFSFCLSEVLSLYSQLRPFFLSSRLFTVYV